MGNWAFCAVLTLPLGPYAQEDFPYQVKTPQKSMQCDDSDEHARFLSREHVVTSIINLSCLDNSEVG